VNVDRAGMEAAIAKVKASFASSRAGSYAETAGKATVVVQRMIAAEYAGVLFTLDPAASGLAMVELVHGTAEKLVSGAAHPQTYRFGRYSDDLIGQQIPPIDLKPLLALGRNAETLFRAPQDMEWTWKNGKFHIVQSRDITSSMSAVQKSLARALELARRNPPDAVVFSKNELAEMLPRPTPLSLSLMESLWASGGSVDLACRALRLSYAVEEDSPPYFVSILGRLYLNKGEERARTLNIGPLAARRLTRAAEPIEQQFRGAFLPKFLAHARVAQAADFESLSTADLFDTLELAHDRFVHTTHVEADVVNIAANFYLSRARQMLTRHGLDPSVYLGHAPETEEARAITEASGASGDERHLLLLASMGHRAVLDYELSTARFSETPLALDELPVRHPAMIRPMRPEAACPQEKLPGVVKAVITAAATACRFQALKEDARHHCLRELALLRRILLVLDRRLELDGFCFFLTFDELLGLRSQSADAMREVASERQRERAELLEHEPLPSTLTVRDLETISMGGRAFHDETSDVIRGTLVSDSGTVTGRARVVSQADAECGRSIDRFEDGDIIVAPMMHPAWLAYFGRAAGFVCEIGGWLSHTAIMAREYNVAMIVGTRGLSRVTDGSLLQLHPNGLVEIVREEKLERAAAAE
jgi:phosphohistidine swiveling domain-containing protein